MARATARIGRDEASRRKEKDRREGKRRIGVSVERGGRARREGRGERASERATRRREGGSRLRDGERERRREGKRGEDSLSVRRASRIEKDAC